MEEYLNYCLSSLVIEDEALMESLEVLVINDGSKDNSSEIAHRFEEQFAQTFRVIDKENGNYGSCINRGLKEANGKYIKVLDADDSFDTTNFKAFLQFLQGCNEDLILSSFNIVDENRVVQKSIEYPFNENRTYQFSEIGGSDAFGLMEMHAVTYKRENLLKLGYHQTEGISFTDQQWIFLPMTQVDTIATYSKAIYLYLIGREGQTMDPIVQARQKSHLIKCIYGMIDSYSAYKECADNSHLSYLHARLRPLIKGIYLYYFTHNDPSSIKVLEEFDEIFRSKDTQLYTYIASHNVSSIAGFDYIAFWRRNYKRNKLITKGFYIIISFLLKIK